MKTQAGWPVNELGEIVVSNGVGTLNITGVVAEDYLPVDDNGKVVVAGLSAGGGVSYADLASVIDNTKGTSLVGYKLAASPSGRTLSSKLSETVSVVDYADTGALADGTTDWTAAFLRAKATGKRVRVPVGIFRITADITKGGLPLFLEGETPAFITHADAANVITDTYSSDYTGQPTVALAKSYSIILCDGCSLAGSVDTTTVNASNNLRSIKNIVLWAKNDAKIGLYTTGSDCRVEDCTAVLFKWFGIATRGQIISSYSKLSTFDCGWALAGTGTAGYPNTYYSGCGMIVLANNIPNDYTSLETTNRPTTLNFKDVFFSVRQHTSANKSGFRGLQAHNMLQFEMSNVGGYTGNLYNICDGGDLSEYIESYAAHGYIAGDNTPFCRSVINSNLTVKSGYTSQSNAGAIDSIIDNLLPFVKTTLVYRNSEGMYCQKNKPITTTYVKAVKSTAGGTTSTYTFDNFLTNTDGFSGFITASMVKKVDYREHTTAFFAASAYRAGVGTWVNMPSTRLANDTSISDINYKIDITISWNTTALVINVAWGTLYSANVDFDLRISAFGAKALST